jgi:hypothetical protein
MNNNLTKKERNHLGKVKSLPCSVCDAPAPSEAHHVKQHRQYTCIALCKDCHTGTMGIHGTKNLWKIRKMEEIDALNVTLERLFNNEESYGPSFW